LSEYQIGHAPIVLKEAFPVQPTHARSKDSPFWGASFIFSQSSPPTRRYIKIC
jgi:hypothetical protein